MNALFRRYIDYYTDTILIFIHLYINASMHTRHTYIDAPLHRINPSIHQYTSTLKVDAPKHLSTHTPYINTDNILIRQLIYQCIDVHVCIDNISTFIYRCIYKCIYFNVFPTSVHICIY